MQKPNWKGRIMMAFHLKGANVPHRKNTEGMSAVRMPTPQTVTIPTVMHIGAPATPVVKVGDHVDIGTVIATQNGAVSSYIHASVSGEVSAVSDMLLSNGKRVPAITIKSDGQDTVSDSVAPPEVTDRDSLIEALKQSGIVGLGGAGFPTYVKFNTSKPIEVLIINGAECEPYITSDSITMAERADDIAYAIDTLCNHLNIGKVVIGIENNKPKAIASMKSLAAKDSRVSVKVLPRLYPQGGEMVLIYHTTGRVVAGGMLPIDVGCVVCNCTTMATIGSYLKTGMPLIEKCITVDGSAIKEPKNVIAPIGTTVRDVFEFSGGFKADPAKVLYGGPMMGIAVPDLDAPVLKNTNALLAFDQSIIKLEKATACIRCAACANHCPFGINPAFIAKAYKNGDLVTAEREGVEVCMECGCCSYVCPAKRPLVQTNRLAKAALRAKKAKEANK